jgi:hypothetical protein
MHKLDFYAMDFYVLIRFSCSLAPEDGVAANEELAMQASMVSCLFVHINMFTTERWFLCDCLTFFMPSEADVLCLSLI